ncbi:Sugar phosphate isomerase/epimerase [Planctomycetales bacterium 10988]|nr:Sugar phosphate isomerase/epimerase [Planctomycetales bacterium 10988]
MLPQLRVAVPLRVFGLPLRKAIESAARLGAQAIEIDARQDLRPHELSETGVREIRKVLDDLQLKVAALRFETRRGYDMLQDLDARVEATKQAMKMAYRLGTPHVFNTVGNLTSSDETANDLLVQVLTDLVHFGNQTGAWLTARTGYESGEELMELIKHLPEGGLPVAFDPGSLLINRYSVSEALEKLGPSIQYVILKDGVQDLSRGRGMEVPLGRGSVDFFALLGVLENYNYQGFLGLGKEQYESERELSNAIQYVKNLWT